MTKTSIIQEPISRAELKTIAEERHGDMVKAVVDVEQSIMALGCDLHADAEQVLLENGSKQENLWGINLYPGIQDESWLEFDSMINLRPSQNNRTRGVDDPNLQKVITGIVDSLTTN